ncbi:hypothetical protein BSKO_05388 [Bryopsis sp. KO-2023]|nr:hypothetical protein BSKO_05388 [Bryopsis sp. KO-2023]
MAQTRGNRGEPWQSGDILNCFDDFDTCVVTGCMPCLVFSENRSMLHGHDKSMRDDVDPCMMYTTLMILSGCTLQCLYAYGTRTDIRRKYNLEEQPCGDCMTHVFCHFCALCQEYRELKARPLTPWPLPAIDAQPLPPQHLHQQPTSPMSLSYQASSPSASYLPQQHMPPPTALHHPQPIPYYAYANPYHIPPVGYYQAPPQPQYQPGTPLPQEGMIFPGIGLIRHIPKTQTPP